jgi:hypothetical protein
MVTRVELEHEFVGDDAATLDVDTSVIVDLAQEAPTEFNGSDAGMGAARKHALDHTL